VSSSKPVKLGTEPGGAGGGKAACTPTMKASSGSSRRALKASRVLRKRK